MKITDEEIKKLIFKSPQCSKFIQNSQWNGVYNWLFSKLGLQANEMKDITEFFERAIPHFEEMLKAGKVIPDFCFIGEDNISLTDFRGFAFIGRNAFQDTTTGGQPAIFSDMDTVGDGLYISKHSLARAVAAFPELNGNSFSLVDNQAFKGSDISKINFGWTRDERTFNETLGVPIYFGTGCFDGCKNLTEVTLPGNSYWSEQVFTNCSSLQKAAISTCNVKRGLFMGCPSLTTVEFSSHFIASLNDDEVKQLASAFTNNDSIIKIVVWDLFNDDSSKPYKNAMLLKSCISELVYGKKDSANLKLETPHSIHK